MSNTETATSNINMEKAELLNRTFAQRFNSKQPSLGLADIPSANSDNLSDNIMCSEEEAYELLCSLDTTKPVVMTTSDNGGKYVTICWQLYCPVCNATDYAILQSNFDGISIWTESNLLQFNVNTCLFLATLMLTRGFTPFTFSKWCCTGKSGQL